MLINLNNSSINQFNTGETMTLIFIITDNNTAYMEYEYTGRMPQLRKRSVEIDLTEDQIKQIGLRQLGVDCGKPVMEYIESVNMSLTNLHQ